MDLESVIKCNEAKLTLTVHVDHTIRVVVQELYGDWTDADIQSYTSTQPLPKTAVIQAVDNMIDEAIMQGFQIVEIFLNVPLDLSFLSISGDLQELAKENRAVMWLCIYAPLNQEDSDDYQNQ